MRRPLVGRVLAITLFGWCGFALAADALICVQQVAYVRYVQGVVFLEDEGNLHPLPGALITVARGDFEKETTSDEEGYFSISNLSPGNYEIRVSLDGFNTALGEVRVRDDIPSDRALHLAIEIVYVDSCGTVEDVSWEELRRLQKP